MIQKIAAPGVFLINLYDPIQHAPLYRDLRELWVQGSSIPATGPKTAFRTRAQGSAARSVAGAWSYSSLQAPLDIVIIEIQFSI